MLIVSPLARNDLLRIYQYGKTQWGAAQAGNYLSALGESFWVLRNQPSIGADREDVLPGIRSFPVASHTIFYTLKGEDVEIVRVLHRRQDAARNL